MKNLVLTGGTFDIIHIGHINFLKKGKSLGDTLVVQISGEKEGLFSSRKRASVLSAIRFVDFVFIHSASFYDERILEKIKPDIILFDKNSYTEEAREKLKNFKGRIVVVKRYF